MTPYGIKLDQEKPITMYRFPEIDESHIEVALERNKEHSRDFSGSVGCAA